MTMKAQIMAWFEKPLRPVFEYSGDRGKIKIQEKRIVEFSDGLRGKRTNVLDNFLTVDSNQPLCGWFFELINWR